ncbi:hypothetical protein T484DRAFT_1905751, partial [Baffinella frigidus]
MLGHCDRFSRLIAVLEQAAAGPFGHCDRFSRVIAVLEQAAAGPPQKVSSSGEVCVLGGGGGGLAPHLRHEAVRGLLQLVPATMNHLPTSRFTALWSVLLSLAAPGRMPPKIRAEVVSVLTRMQATSNYRPSIALPGEAEARSSEVAKTTSNYRPSIALPGEAAARCPMAIIRPKRQSVPRTGSTEGDGKGGEEGEKAPGGGGWLDTRGLFSLLLLAIEGEQNPEVFLAAAQGMLRGVRNRLVFEDEDMPSLTSLLIHKLAGGNSTPFGAHSTAFGPPIPAGTSHEEALRLRNFYHELGYQLLGTVLGGWAPDLSPQLKREALLCLVQIKREALPCLVQGLVSRHNLPGWGSGGGDGGGVEALSGGEPWWVRADAEKVWGVVAGNGGVTAMCLDHLSISSCTIPECVPLHAGRVMDLLGLLVQVWNRGREGRAERKEEKEEAPRVNMVIKLLHYMKFTAVQIPLIPGGLQPIVFERALESILNLLDRARLVNARVTGHADAEANCPRWGGLVANLANRAIALWYLHADAAFRVRFTNETAAPLLQERREDAMFAIMLDFFLRNATTTRGKGAGEVDHTESLFAAPGTLRRTYAVGDSLVSIRSARVGLVDMCARRPTDMRRWVFFAPPARGGENSNTTDSTFDALLRLLTSRLQ